MNVHVRWMMVLAVSIFLVMPVSAQDTEESAAEDVPPSGRRGWVFGEVTLWSSQPTGLDFFPASQRNELDPFNRASLVSVPQDTKQRGRYRAGYELMKNIGAIVATYWSQTNIESLVDLRPSQFVFGAILTSPVEFAGVFDDGLADGFEANTTASTRDFRLDFSRRAFRSNRAVGRWFVGYRRVSHERKMNVEYYALVPNLPPVLPPLPGPRPDLDPTPDAVYFKSQFEGRGAEAGFDVELEITKKVRVEAGFAVAVLRGSNDAEYRSTTHFYATTQDGEPLLILDLPEDADLFSDPAVVPTIAQFAVPYGTMATSISSDAQVLETYLGFRWNAWKGLDAIAGFRNVRYDGVGMEVRQSPGAVSESDFRVSTDMSVNYEGYYLGVSYRY